MKILIDGYEDKNLGDDLMMFLATNGLREHKLYTPKENFVSGNVEYTTAKSGFDIYLKVTGSGFLIYNTKGIFYRLRDMLRESGYASKKAVINCNISPFISKTAETVIQNHLKSCDFITVRDEASYQYIKNHAPNVICQKYCDMVFSLPDEVIPQTKCNNSLGIAVRPGADILGLAAIGDGYIKETGFIVKLLCFDAGEENDILTAKKIRNAMKYQSNTEIAVYDNFNQILSQMKECAVILGLRLHSNILAARMNIPFVPMAYSEKTSAALFEAGYNGLIYDFKNFNPQNVLHELLNAEPFELDKSVIISADMHIRAFNIYIGEMPIK